MALLLCSCGLDSSQEKSLNLALSKYLFAVNSDLKLSRASYTHPAILKHYKSKGNNAFKTLFKKEDGIWRDAVMGKIANDGKLIHVQLKVLTSVYFQSDRSNERFEIYAISSDDGNSWFFVEGKDYKSKSCGKFKRLIQ